MPICYMKHSKLTVLNNYLRFSYNKRQFESGIGENTQMWLRFTLNPVIKSIFSIFL